MTMMALCKCSSLAALPRRHLPMHQLIICRLSQVDPCCTLQHSHHLCILPFTRAPLPSRSLAHSGDFKPLNFPSDEVAKGLQAASWRRSHHQCRRVKESPGAASSGKF